jgi:hypothetical protein
MLVMLSGYPSEVSNQKADSQ